MLDIRSIILEVQIVHLHIFISKMVVLWAYYEENDNNLRFSKLKQTDVLVC